MSVASHELNPDLGLLRELEPTAEKLFDRHMSMSEKHAFVPALLIPFDHAKTFPPNYKWSPDECPLPDAVRSALFVNLLTEDNLPYYHRDIERMFGRSGIWGTWVRRWTAEEGKHSQVLRDYLTVTRAVDPVELERAYMAQVSGGKVPEPPTAADGLIYVSMQELATRISHRNTGVILEASLRETHPELAEAGIEIARVVSRDENRHHLFYRDLATETIEYDPSMAVKAMKRQVIGFQMPGTGIPDFLTHAKRIAKAGIYDLSRFYEDIVDPLVLKHWKLDEIQGLDPQAEEDREELMLHIGKVAKASKRTREKREAREAAAIEIHAAM